MPDNPRQGDFSDPTPDALGRLEERLERPEPAPTEMEDIPIS